MVQKKVWVCPPRVSVAWMRPSKAIAGKTVINSAAVRIKGNVFFMARAFRKTASRHVVFVDDVRCIAVTGIGNESTQPRAAGADAVTADSDVIGINPEAAAAGTITVVDNESMHSIAADAVAVATNGNLVGDHPVAAAAA